MKMREIINLIETQVGLPEFVYHGTSVEHWEEDYGRSSEFYLTNHPGVAERYAREWEEDLGETPIIIKFRLSDLINLSHAKPEPNWEYVEQVAREHGQTADDIADQFTWERTLEEVGTFCIQGFTDADKRFGEIISLT